MANGALSEVRIKAGLVELEGELVLPESPLGVVLFAHGSGSSRHSRRNRYVAWALQEGRPFRNPIEGRTLRWFS